MPSLSIKLLGSFTVDVDKQPINNFYTVKARALLAYLAVEGTRVLDRSHLAGIIWPDTLESSARGSLRHALANVRKVVSDKNATPTHFLVDRRSVQLNPQALAQETLTVDVLHFQTLYQHAIQPRTTDPQRASTPTIDLDAALEAIDLYRGPFLENDLLIDSPDFDAWVQLQREILNRQMTELLARVTHDLRAAGDFASAAAYAQRMVDHEPWREEAHVQLMNVLWRNGQADAAMRQYEECRQRLQAELDVAPSSETVALYEAIRDGRDLFQGRAAMSATETTREPPLEQAEPPPMQSQEPPETAESSQPLHNIPAQAKSFIGREGELSEIESRFAQPHCRLLTIIGPGGMGKTQLALEYARRSIRNFADGVWFVSLTGVADHQQVPSTVIDSLGILMSPEQDPQARLSQYLRDKSLLLVLDNYEHLRAGAGFVSDLLAQGAGLSILVTSRERLNLQVETVFPLGGLDLPPADHQSDQAENGQVDNHQAAGESGAVALFVDCAQRVNALFTLSPQERSAVNEICRLIDGMPLGIELAAVWTRLLPCHEILENLQRSIDLLTVSMPDVPARHRSMRALIEESWHNLSDETKRVFACASIFRGGCDWPALQEVTKANMLNVAELVDQGFLRRTSDGSYQIHELMRQFGAEILAQTAASADSVTEEEVARDHAHYYLNLLQQTEADLIGSEQIHALQIVARNIENIRLAWEWALVNRADSLIDAAAEALFKFYSGRGKTYEGEAIFALAAEHLATDVSKCVSLFVRIRNYLSAFLELLGRSEEGKDLLEENVALARQHNLHNELGWALLHLGTIVAWSDVEQAKPMFEESQMLFQHTEDTEGVIAVLGSLFNFILVRQVDREPARAVAEEALDWARTLDAPLLVARCLTQLGTIYRIQGKHRQAYAYTEEAVELSRNLKNPILEAELLNNLAVTAYDEQNYQYARTLMEECVMRYREASLENSTALIFEENLGRLAQRLREWDVAQHQFQETAVKSQRANNHFMFARCNEGLAQVWVKRGDLQQARQALQMARGVKDYWKLSEMKAFVLNNLVTILMAEDSYETAAKLFAFKDGLVLHFKNTEFDDEAVRERLRQNLGEHRLHAILEEAPTLDIDQLVDSVL